MSDSLDFDLHRRARYSQGAGIYRILPAAVARPASRDELRRVLRQAQTKGWSVTARGAGTAMSGNNVGEGVVVDMTHFEQGRCRIEQHRATCSPALTLAALQQRAAEGSLRFPPNPSSQQWATLGGMVATNASGARSFRFGAVRDWIAALTIETADGPLRLHRGEAPDAAHPVVQRWLADALPRIRSARATISERFPQVSKSSTGYALDCFLKSGDLLDLVIGAEGTLGIVTEVQCRLARMPRHRVAMRLLVRSRASLVPVIRALQQAGASSIEFLDRTFLQLIDPTLAGSAAPLIPQAAGVILADLEGDDPEQLAASAAEVLAATESEIRFGEVASRPDQIEVLWQLRHGASPALARMDDGRRSLQVIEDGVVPLALLPNYLDAIEAICASEGIAVVLFGHAGDGHVHANLLPNLTDPDWLQAVERIYRRVNQELLRLGGALSGEHGVGRLRATMLSAQYGPQVLELFQAVKSAFDPVGRFNPGLWPAGSPSPLAQLKVGANAAPLPASEVAWLEGAEARADWGAPRW